MPFDAIADAKRLIEKAKGGKGRVFNRWPAGNQKGGQFRPKGGGKGSGGGSKASGGGSGAGGGLDAQWAAFFGAGGGKPKAPPKGSAPHPQKNDDGKPVTINYPTKASPLSEVADKNKTATFAAGGAAPKSLNGTKFSSWTDAPTTKAGWAKVAGQADIDEPPLDTKGKKAGAGVVIVEKDGRVWLTTPTNSFGGYKNTFPKGTAERGLSMQANAIKEAFEETGLQVKITAHLGDFERDTSVGRYYLATRVGGTPKDMGWESQAVRLATPKDMKSLLNRKVDKDIVDAIDHLRDLAGGSLFIKGFSQVTKEKAGAWSKQPRWKAGTPLGGQWKGTDGKGLTTPPTIAGGMAGKNKAYQKKADAAYALAQKGDSGALSAQLGPMVQKVVDNQKAGKKSSHVKWHAQVTQYVGELVTNMKQGVAAGASAMGLGNLPLLSNWTKSGAKPGGSAAGAIFTDENGQDWLVKSYDTPKQAAVEVMSAQLLKATGANVVEMKLVDLEGQFKGGVGVASKMIDEPVKDLSLGAKSAVKQTKGDFAAQAWLNNWDAIGLTMDNTVVGANSGKAYHVDPGGSMMMKATGGTKPFGNKADAWDTMRDPKLNPNGAKVYGGMSKTELMVSAEKVLGVSDKQITSIVMGVGKAAGLSNSESAVIAATMIERKKDIGAKSGMTATIKLDPVPKETKAKPTKGLGDPPKFNTGFKAADDVYAQHANYIKQAHDTGDAKALYNLKGNNKFVKDVTGDSAAAQSLMSYYKEAVAGVAAAQGKAKAASAKEGAVTQNSKGESFKVKGGVREPVGGKAQPKVALPDFEGAKLPSSNTNASSHNGKIDQIKAAAEKGDTAGILALKYGSNTYAKKQVKIANDALAALGSAHVVSLKQKANSHPAIADPSLTAEQAAKVAPVKTRGKLPANKLPKKYDFENWNGPGQGLSSKGHVNKANAEAQDAIAKVALSGNMKKLQNLTFAALDKETGTPIGQKPMSEHPSKHVQQFHQDAMNALNLHLNPPKPLRLKQTSLATSVAGLAAEIKGKPIGTTINQVQSDEKVGFWFGLGHAPNAAGMKVKSFAASKDFVSNGYKIMNEAQNSNPLLYKFAKAVQSSSSLMNSYQNGEQTAFGENLKSWSKHVVKTAPVMPTGLRVHRWQNMGADMMKELQKAQPGTVLQGTSPMPTSMSPTGTQHFGHHRFKMIFAEGAKAIPSFGTGGFKTEKEVTILPGTRMMLLDKGPSSVKGKGMDFTVLVLPPDDD